MPWRYDLDPETGILILEVSGPLGDEDLLEIAEAVVPYADSASGLLADLLQADGKQVSAQGVRVLGRWEEVFPSEFRVAILVPSDLGYGMARMFSTHREAKGESVRVFRELDEARRWLGLPGTEDDKGADDDED